jgi:hypothetical protein
MTFDPLVPVDDGENGMSKPIPLLTSPTGYCVCEPLGRCSAWYVGETCCCAIEVEGPKPKDNLGVVVGTNGIYPLLPCVIASIIGDTGAKNCRSNPPGVSMGCMSIGLGTVVEGIVRPPGAA